LIKEIENDTVPSKYLIKRHVGIDAKHFDVVHDAMQDAIYVTTGGRAAIKDIIVCGKTGTAENPHGYDHSVFMAFAPKEDPKIAVSVYVENAGWGGRAAASIAALVIEKHIRGYISKEKQYLEEYVLTGEFIY